MFKPIEILNKRIEKKIRARGIHQDTSLEGARERLFIKSHLLVLILGLIAYVPGSILSFRNDWYLMFFGQTVTYFGLLLLYLLDTLAWKLKVYFIIALVYFFGLFVILVEEAHSQGLIWLITSSVLASIFLKMKPAVATLFINFFIMVAIALISWFDLLDIAVYNTFELDNWISLLINLVLINVVTVLLLVFFIQGLEKSLVGEQNLKVKLKRKSERLINAKVKAEESDQLKSAFLANVSHEFRTPLNALLGFTDVMLYTQTNEEKRKEYLEQMKESGELLLQIINNTIEYSKIEMGTLSFTTREVDISRFITCLYEKYVDKCPEGVIFEKKEIQATKDKVINTDEGKLETIFSNLISNAFKFTTKGSVVFGIMTSDVKGFYKFYVKDTGIGIPLKRKQDIFTRFHKEDEFKEGTGLGLSISATLISLMGGRIWLDSEPGKGTSFYFTLPKKFVPRD